MGDTLIYATWAMAIASIAGAYYARKAVRDQKENFGVQIAEYKLALYAETTLKFEERFNDLHFKQIRSRAALALLDNQGEEDAEDVFDFFETLGLFVKRGALDEGIAYSVFFHWINLYWQAGKRHIAVRRQDAASLWGDFSFLYNRVYEIEKRNDPDSEDLKMSDQRLHQQLQEEIDLVRAIH